ncbi:MAG TPA: hypothetical protein VG056_09435 [Pirellulales bacterium]|nr:hypothetical protein [Pirellulales bacterium]
MLTIGSLLRPAAGDDLPGCRNGNCPNCPVNSKYFGYYPTIWRRWPGTEPQPQPVAPPATEGIGVPSVETPPATEEIENKIKPATPDSSGGGPATTNPTPDAANKPSAPPPDEDPNAKKPNVQPDNGAAPDAPQKLNQVPPNRGIDVAPAYFESNRQPLRSTGRAPEAWPPSNVLRHDEIRASFQFPDGVTLPTATAIPNAATATSTPGFPSPKRSDGGQPKPCALASPAWQADATPLPLWPQPNSSRPREAPAPAAAHAQLSPPLDWNAHQIRPADSWHTDLGPSPAVSSSLSDDARPSKPAPTTPSNGAQALHWMDPAQPKSLSRDSSPSGRSPSVLDNPFNDAPCSSAQARATQPAEIVLKPSADNLKVAARRIPFIPSMSLGNPVAPLDPRALTEGSVPSRFTPGDASPSRLAPPYKVSDISVPMNSTAAAETRRQAAGTANQDNVSQIDPLAIRRSLEAVKPATPSRSVPCNLSPKDVLQFADGIAPERKGLDGLNAGAANIGKSDLQFAATAIPEKPSRVDPLYLNRLPPAGASVIVSDDGGAQGGVRLTSYTAPVSRPASPAGRDNPLRAATRPSREVLSTDTTQVAWPEPPNGAAARSASGWTNPLR